MTEFHQSDLAANSLIYVHTSEEEIYADRFKFSVSDGTNEVRARSARHVYHH